MGKQQANSGEGTAASNIQFFTDQELMEQEYAREVRVNERAVGHSNPLTTGDLQAALDGRPGALKWGVDTTKALAYFVAVPVGTPGSRPLRIVGNTFQFAMRQALKKLNVPLPKGKVAFMPMEVQNIPGVGVALVINAKKPRYEDVPPKPERKSKKNQQHNEQGKQTALQSGAVTANPPVSGDAAAKDAGAKDAGAKDAGAKDAGAKG